MVRKHTGGVVAGMMMGFLRYKVPVLPDSGWVHRFGRLPGRDPVFRG